VQTWQQQQRQQQQQRLLLQAYQLLLLLQAYHKPSTLGQEPCSHLSSPALHSVGPAQMQQPKQQQLQGTFVVQCV
jgi:hypothetical protein